MNFGNAELSNSSNQSVALRSPDPRLQNFGSRGTAVPLCWPGFNTPVTKGRHICAQSESKRSANSLGVVPVGPCICCLSFPSRRRRPGYCCPYRCIFTMLREQPHLGHSVVSSLQACHHAGHIVSVLSNTPGPITKSSFIVEHELGQESKTPQENHQRALREKKTVSLDSMFCFAVTMARCRRSCW
jgi:hypothetical protein